MVFVQLAGHVSTLYQLYFACIQPCCIIWYIHVHSTNEISESCVRSVWPCSHFSTAGLARSCFFLHAHVGSRCVSKNWQSRMKHIYEHNRMAHAYIWIMNHDVWARKHISCILRWLDIYFCCGHGSCIEETDRWPSPRGREGFAAAVHGESLQHPSGEWTHVVFNCPQSLDWCTWKQPGRDRHQSRSCPEALPGLLWVWLRPQRVPQDLHRTGCGWPVQWGYACLQWQVDSAVQQPVSLIIHSGVVALCSFSSVVYI